MAIDRSQKISAFKTSHQHKRNYNSVRACVGESQEIQAFSLICPPIGHSLIMIIRRIRHKNGRIRGHKRTNSNKKLISNFKRCSSKGVLFDSPGIAVAIGF